jgi:hypothetical protein
VPGVRSIVFGRERRLFRKDGERVSEREVVIVLRRYVIGMLIGWLAKQTHSVRFETKPMLRVQQLQQWMLNGIEISGRGKSCRRIPVSSGLGLS